MWGVGVSVSGHPSFTTAREYFRLKKSWACLIVEFLALFKINYFKKRLLKKEMD